MITIPTGDFVGILSDVIPMADSSKDATLTRSVRLEWDGDELHAFATDRFHLGWGSWGPDDEPAEDHQPDMMTEWGGGDEPWGITVRLDDAVHLVTVFKLKGKGVYYVPLTLDHLGGSVRVQRSHDTGHTALSETVKGYGFSFTFPDLRALLAKNDVVESTPGLTFNAKRLAHFAKVRPRGPMVMRFTGPDGLVHISIGDRFVGAIMPVREGQPIAAVPDPEPVVVPEPADEDGAGDPLEFREADDE